MTIYITVTYLIGFGLVYGRSIIDNKNIDSIIVSLILFVLSPLLVPIFIGMALSEMK